MPARKPRPTPRAARKVRDILDAFGVAPFPAPPVVTKRPAHRPSSYTPEIAKAFCDRLGAGELAINLCEEDGMPSLRMVFTWRESHPEFSAMYAHAREQQGHTAAEKAVRCGEAATPENAAAARVHFDAYRWFAAKLLPKVYGDKVEHSGNIDVTVGLADRLDAARKRLALAAAGKLIEGTVVAADPPKPDGEC